MKKQYFTNGEWLVTKSGKGKFNTEFTITCKTPKCDKCEMSRGQYYIAKTLSSATGIIEAEANARLISQSPKLLELLQECILQLDKYSIPDTSEELTSLISRSKQVINKSLGE